MWENQASSSVTFCRPILIEFSKEEPEKTASVVDETKAQIATLIPTSISKHGKGIEIKFTLFLTMVEGKVGHVLSETS